MSIERAIKQVKPFKNEFLKAHINIIFTASWLQNQILKLLKPFGVTPQQYNLLRILKGSYPDPRSVKDLTERMLDKTSNASRLVDKLLEKNLVDRKICPMDRRQVEIFITLKGLELLEQASNQVDKSTAEIFKNMNVEEASELSRLLDKLRG